VSAARRHRNWFARAAAAAFSGVLLLAAAGCSRRQETASESWQAMGTVVSLTLAGPERDRVRPLADGLKSAMAGMESRWSLYDPKSEVCVLAAGAGKASAQISPDTEEVLRLAIRYAEVSGGAFDPTVAPLVRMWGFSGGELPKRLPTDAAVAAARARVGYARLAVGKGVARLADPGMTVDLGGIAKGYAADLCCERMEDLGVRRAMVNVGGNIRVMGPAALGRPWRIGIRNPFDRDTIVGVIELPAGMAVATSGNYERFVTIGGRRYAHILDPRTGRPVEGMAAVTVIARTAVEADAMSTALFVLGPGPRSAEALARLPGCHALFIPDRQPLRLVTSSGFEKYFEPAPYLTDRPEPLDEPAKKGPP
jgi:thiamine biosynthesis lipoprotein